MAILLNGWILPNDGVASGRLCACSLGSRLVIYVTEMIVETFVTVIVVTVNTHTKIIFFGV